MIYLLLGNDRTAKQKKIAEIKTACLPGTEAREFDHAVLDAPKLDPDTLKKALIALPAVAKKRLVLIRDVDKLSSHNKELVQEFLRGDNAHADVILDTDAASLKGEFGRVAAHGSEIYRFGQSEKKASLWDMTRAIERRDAASALKTLDELLNDGQVPVLIMGGLVWFWGSVKHRVSAEGFKKGLLVLQEADLNIKRSRLKPQHAIEIAVTQLSHLIAC